MFLFHSTYVICQQVAPFSIGSEKVVYSTESLNVDLNLLALDVNNDALSFSIVDSEDVKGVVGIDNATGLLTYTPDSTFSGSVELLFIANDGNEDSNTSTINVDVIQKDNLPPVAYNNHYSLKENSSLNFTLNGYDPEGNENLNYNIVSQTDNGLVELNSNTGVATYSPDSGFYGTDSFVFFAEDNNQLRSQDTTIDFTVRRLPNNPPVSKAFSTSTDQDMAVDINLGGYDSDGDDLVFTLEKQPSYGSLSVDENGEGSYEPTEGYYGEDVFEFSVSDGTTSSSISKGIISVLRIENNPPVGFNTTSVIGYNSSNIYFQPSFVDIDDDEVTSSINQQPLNGAVSIITTSGEFSYTPKTDFVGSDSFIYTLDDGVSQSDQIVKFINITGPGDLNSDGIINSLDLIFLASNVVKVNGFEMPDSFQHVFDINNDESISATDIIHLASYVAGIKGFDINP